MTEAYVSSQNDSRPHFELSISLPADVRFAETARELAVHAARHAGLSDAKAHAFGDEVVEVLRAHIADGAAGGRVPLVVRRAGGPVEVLVDGRTITPDP